MTAQHGSDSGLVPPTEVRAVVGRVEQYDKLILNDRSHPLTILSVGDATLRVEGRHGGTYRIRPSATGDNYLVCRETDNGERVRQPVSNLAVAEAHELTSGSVYAITEEFPDSGFFILTAVGLSELSFGGRYDPTNWVEAIKVISDDGDEYRTYNREHLKRGVKERIFEGRLQKVDTFDFAGDELKPTHRDTDTGQPVAFTNPREAGVDAVDTDGNRQPVPWQEVLETDRYDPLVADE